MSEGANGVPHGTCTNVLTDREEDVLDLLLEGLSNKEIAQELSITEQCVKNHLAVVYRKRGVTSARQIFALVLKISCKSEQSERNI